MGKKGFTLVEILIVVVIIVSVAAFGLPAYKKSQERNQYTAATGVLLDIASAKRLLAEDLPALEEADESEISVFNFGGQVTSTHQLTSDDTYKSALPAENSATGRKITETNLPYALFARGYLRPIPYDDATNSKYKGYKFYICGTADCCKNGAIACMQYADFGSCSGVAPTDKPNSEARAMYCGARVDDTGILTRLVRK